MVRTGSQPSTTTFTYDNNGNQLTSATTGRTETRTYDALNRLTRVTATGTPALTATYTYRPDGLRNSQVVNNVTTAHVWNGGHIVLDLTATARGTVRNRYARSIYGRFIRSDHDGWYVFDGRGSVVQRLNNTGVVLRTYRYTAFGNEFGYSVTNANPFRFNGMFWDGHRGEYMTPNRMFNPRVGRWSQPDPHWNIENMLFGDDPQLLSNLPPEMFFGDGHAHMRLFGSGLISVRNSWS